MTTNNGTAILNRMIDPENDDLSPDVGPPWGLGFDALLLRPARLAQRRLRRERSDLAMKSAFLPFWDRGIQLSVFKQEDRLESKTGRPLEESLAATCRSTARGSTKSKSSSASSHDVFCDAAISPRLLPCKSGCWLSSTTSIGLLPNRSTGPTRGVHWQSQPTNAPSPGRKNGQESEKLGEFSLWWPDNYELRH